jgi:DUF1009 family protein
MKELGIMNTALESGAVIILDKTTLLSSAKKWGIGIVGI